MITKRAEVGLTDNNGLISTVFISDLFWSWARRDKVWFWPSFFIYKYKSEGLNQQLCRVRTHAWVFIYTCYQHCHGVQNFFSPNVAFCCWNSSWSLTSCAVCAPCLPENIRITNIRVKGRIRSGGFLSIFTYTEDGLFQVWIVKGWWLPRRVRAPP